jgi:large subunit ribosomal protein L25
MATQSTKLSISARTPEGSRATRRLRRSGRVPGVLYGGDGDPIAFSADARELRNALAARGAVLEVVDEGRATPAILKSAQYHPVRGETMHVDLLRVNLDIAIHAVVALELVGADDSPGVKNGGVLEQITRELNIEALPAAIPESLTYDVSAMEINDTVTLADVPVPAGVVLLDDVEETVVATLTPPRVESETDDIESETERVGESAGAGAAAADVGDSH